MEYLNLYDENKELMNEVMLRSKNMKIEDGKYINIVIVFIQNSEGKFLIQKTSKQKGSIWATTGGHVKAGSTNIKTIIEEIKEELGIIVKENELKHFYAEKRHPLYIDAYYLNKDLDINELTLQKEEVNYVEWLSINKIQKLIKEDKFRKGNINSFERLLTIINSL